MTSYARNAFRFAADQVCHSDGGATTRCRYRIGTTPAASGGNEPGGVGATEGIAVGGAVSIAVTEAGAFGALATAEATSSVGLDAPAAGRPLPAASTTATSAATPSVAAPVTAIARRRIELVSSPAIAPLDDWAPLDAARRRIVVRRRFGVRIA